MFSSLVLLYSWLPPKLSVLIIAAVILFTIWSVIRLVNALFVLIPFL